MKPLDQDQHTVCKVACHHKPDDIDSNPNMLFCARSSGGTSRALPPSPRRKTTKGTGRSENRLKVSNSFHCTNPCPSGGSKGRDSGKASKLSSTVHYLLSIEGMQPLEGRSRSWSGGGKGRAVLSVKVNASIPRTTKLMVPS